MSPPVGAVGDREGRDVVRGTGRIFRNPASQNLHIAYFHRGREHRESCGSPREADARRLLRQRLAAIETHSFIPQEQRVTVEQLLDGLETHLETRGAKAVGTLRSHLKPVRVFFALARALEVTTAEVERYVASRLAAGKARATVNREVGGLRQAFNLAVKQTRLIRAPYIPMLSVDNARQGFFEHGEFEAVVARLSPPLADLARFAYLTGWRRGEIVSLRWDAVDRAGREIRLRTSKNGHGRVLPLEGALSDLIEQRWAAREIKEADGVTRLAECVFHRNGRPIVEFKKRWGHACREAGAPGKLFHDLRRTAVRNMIRAGVPQAVAMSISGHRTISMFLRYNIASDDDKRDALRKTQAHVGAHPAPPTVVMMGAASRVS